MPRNFRSCQSCIKFLDALQLGSKVEVDKVSIAQTSSLKGKNYFTGFPMCV